MMVEDLRVQAKEAALPGSSEAVALTRAFQSILQSRPIASHVNMYATMIIYSEFDQKCNNLTCVFFFFAIFLRRMMHSLAPWLLSRYNFYMVSLCVFIIFGFFLLYRVSKLRCQLVLKLVLLGSLSDDK